MRYFAIIGVLATCWALQLVLNRLFGLREVGQDDGPRNPHSR